VYPCNGDSEGKECFEISVVEHEWQADELCVWTQSKLGRDAMLYVAQMR
jgi:hypothetical protein